MQISLDYSFLKETFQFELVFQIVKKFIKFEPEFFTKKNKRVGWDRKIHLNTLEKYRDDDWISFIDRNENLFSTGIAGIREKFRDVSVCQNENVFFPSNEEVESFIDDGFVSAYLHNEDYTFIQSEMFENNLKDRDLEAEIIQSISQTPYKLGMFNSKEFDVKYNPGRKELGPHTWMLPAWKMWFGKPFFEFIPKEKILSFPHATEVKELFSGVVFVQLYDDIHKPFTVENKFRQWKWREWLNYDHLIQG